MSAFWGNLIGVFILVLMVLFVGVWIWAWRPRHSPTFHYMSRIPMGERVAPAAEEDGRS